MSEVTPRGYFEGPTAVISGHAAMAIKVLIDRHEAEWRQLVAPLARTGPEIAAARLAIDAAAAAYNDGRISVDGSLERKPAETPPSSSPMTTDEAASVLGVTPRRVRQLISAGRLAALRVGRQWQIDRKALEEMSP